MTKKIFSLNGHIVDFEISVFFFLHTWCDLMTSVTYNDTKFQTTILNTYYILLYFPSL